MTKVSRSGIVVGAWHSVQCAIRRDGTSPAREFLTELKQGAWDADPELEEVPFDEQIDDYDALLNKMQYVARNGEPERSGDVNYLHSGIWEFKAGNKRLAFFDTDGQGNWERKAKVQDKADSVDPNSPCWWFPEMDEYLRLLNPWPKTGQKAPQDAIDLAITIACEDVNHDV